MNTDELARIDAPPTNTRPTLAWEFDVDLGGSPAGVVSRIRQAVRQIAQLEDAAEWLNAQDKTRWPTWLSDCFPELTIEETDKLIAETSRDRWKDLPWLFPAWIDAISNRGWRWWTIDESDGLVTIVLSVVDLPVRIEAFKKLVTCAGATIVQERKPDESHIASGSKRA